MKKFLSIFLLILFAFNFIGVYLIFEVQQLKIRREMKQIVLQNVPPQKVTLIRVDASNSHLIEWENKNEFSYENKMFDLIKIKKAVDGATLYYCLSDENETNLILEFEKIIAQTKNKSQHEKRSSISELLLNLFPPPVNYQLFFLNDESNLQTNNSDSYFSFIKDTASPPPKPV